MAVDYLDIAKRLEIINVFERGNRTGYVTPKTLYTPRKNAQGDWEVPPLGVVKHWMDHGTVGTNTLPYFAGGSGGRGVCSQYLIPKDRTEFADGKVHDTSLVVFKMVPDGFACNHTGPCMNWDGLPVHNGNTFGVEYENLQDGGRDPFTEWQYIKGAFIYAYAAAVHKIPDFRRIPHGIVAIPFGRRTDPWAGRFDIARSWMHVWGIRADARVWQFWGLQQPQAA